MIGPPNSIYRCPLWMPLKKRLAIADGMFVSRIWPSVCHINTSRDVCDLFFFSLIVHRLFSLFSIDTLLNAMTPMTLVLAPVACRPKSLYSRQLLHLAPYARSSVVGVYEISNQCTLVPNFIIRSIVGVVDGIVRETRFLLFIPCRTRLDYQ